MSNPLRATLEQALSDEVLREAAFQVAEWHSGEYLTCCSQENLADMRTVLLPALETALGERGWQPIETAPKDGRFVFLYDKRNIPGDGVATGRFDSDVGCWYDGCNMDRYLEDESLTPTHWQPLPSPPVLDAGGAER